MSCTGIPLRPFAAKLCVLFLVSHLESASERTTSLEASIGTAELGSSNLHYRDLVSPPAASKGSG